MNKQVLQFILEEENPNGIIECSVDDWFGISYKIPRNKLKEASSLDYINNTGVYILFGDDENTAEKIAYIGEAEDIYNRLSQHNKNKDFWNECIVFVSKDNSLNKAHIKYIEHELYEMSKKANRYIIKNESNPTKSSLSNADEIRAEKFISKIKIIANMFGYKLFISLVDKNDKEDKTLHLTNNGIEYAHGMLTDEGFVVLKGSKVKEGVFNSLSPSLNGFFEKERSSTDLVDNVYINDHLFSSPSMAAIAILGRNANGYTEWKNKDNVSLKKIIGGE